MLCWKQMEMAKADTAYIELNTHLFILRVDHVVFLGHIPIHRELMKNDLCFAFLPSPCSL